MGSLDKVVPNYLHSTLPFKVIYGLKGYVFEVQNLFVVVKVEFESRFWLKSEIINVFW